MLNKSASKRELRPSSSARLRTSGPERRMVAAALAPAVAVVVVILLRASLTSNGFLSSDSRFYLAAATNLARGVGWHVANDGSAPAMLEPFADWPVGYPALIYVVAQMLGTSVFTAAKLLSGSLVLLCAGMIHRAFGPDGPICALPLAFASSLEIFSYTWSEAPFIVLLIASASLLAALWTEPDKSPVLRSVLLGASCIGLFLCRYVGTFSLVLPAIVAIAALHRRLYRVATANLVMLVAAATVIAIYLRHNQALTGFATGMPRQPPADSWTDRLAMLAGAVWSELIVAIHTFDGAEWRSWVALAAEAFGLVSIGRAIRRSYLSPMRQTRFDPPAIAFLGTGMLYLVAIVLLRWRNQFDPYNFRLLGPGALLVTIALMRTALVSWPAARPAITRAAVTLAALSLVFALAALPRPWQARHTASVDATMRRYANIPSGAIVVFGNDDLRYLRPDLFVAMPLCPPWFLEHETWPEFLDRMDHSRLLFLDVSSPPPNLKGCDISIRRAASGYRPGALVQL